nr:MAG TPA: hypothetical protein [Caudoviricetes sp.]
MDATHLHGIRQTSPTRGVLTLKLLQYRCRGARRLQRILYDEFNAHSISPQRLYRLISVQRT